MVTESSLAPQIPGMQRRWPFSFPGSLEWALRLQRRDRKNLYKEESDLQIEVRLGRKAQGVSVTRWVVG